MRLHIDIRMANKAIKLEKYLMLTLDEVIGVLCGLVDSKFGI